MKKILLSSFATLTLIMLHAQELPLNEKGDVEYSKVIQVENLSKSQIFDKAKLWVVSTLKSGDNMVELSGDNSNQIVGTGNVVLEGIEMPGHMKSYKATDTQLNFKFIVACKDGRFRYQINNFLFSYIYTYQQVPKERLSSGLELIKYPEYYDKEKSIVLFQENVRKEVNSKMQILIDDFIKTMTSKKEDDW